MTVVPLDSRRTQTIGGSEAASACGVTSAEWQRFMALVLQTTLSKRRQK